MNDKASVEGFYEECARVLNCAKAHCKSPPGYRKNRWCNRLPGAGRFEGFGIIRAFGETVTISLRHPIGINTSFKSRAEALAFLTFLSSEHLVEKPNGD